MNILIYRVYAPKTQNGDWGVKLIIGAVRRSNPTYTLLYLLNKFSNASKTLALTSAR